MSSLSRNMSRCAIFSASPGGRPKNVDDTKRASAQSHFKESPVKFLKVLMMKIWLNCEELDKTHVGCMLAVLH
jgi:hypothetical protein